MLGLVRGRVLGGRDPGKWGEERYGDKRVRQRVCKTAMGTGETVLEGRGYVIGEV